MKRLALLAVALCFACAVPSRERSTRTAATPVAPTPVEFVQPPSVTDGASWKPAESKLWTRWGRDVRPENAWREYPRPTLVRSSWSNLNGLWEYAINSAEVLPAKWDGAILVPFPVESALSGVGRALKPTERLWYRRNFDVPAEWSGQRLLLHFGAVDWRARVFVNGREAGSHSGGYDPFSLDITELANAGTNRLAVVVEDGTDSAGQPRGKQVLEPNGIWYTPTSGIWQTVWLEPVPQVRVERLRVTASASGHLALDLDLRGGAAAKAELEVLDRDGRVLARGESASGRIELDVQGHELWSPTNPALHGLRVRLVDTNGATLDEVSSYCGFRDIAVLPDARGVRRITLNGEALFQFGPLDQGFWPDGLYTPPSVDAMRFDIDAVRRMGGNMLRKHVKVEPELFYWLCDSLGVLVWQDMPSGNCEQAGWRSNFEAELRELVADRGHHPSIVMWVPFNEGWGQHDTERITRLVANLDPTRLVNNASGWTDKNVGDVIDIHVYPGPGMAPAESARASVLGEFGGTQTTDVEIEVNGWLTYDRAVWKIDPERAAKATKVIYEPPPVTRALVPHAGHGTPGEWRYTFGDPREGWEKTDYDDLGWMSGRASFGTDTTPGAKVGTRWESSFIWLRRAFELESVPANVRLSLHHDEDVQVWINGVLALDRKGYTTGYVTAPISREALAALRPGKNVLAVSCHQTGGGQNIDVGLVTVE
ncbi:MAG: hypothetical protein NTV21_04945 [Planctomycetota bacterium]|nr:hypothetical protein [Planctomycetota bacterium]